MPGDLLFRTEEFERERVLSCLVAQERERQVIDSLKSRSPILLVGSRGVGKTFLLQATRAELENSFTRDRILPVYVAFPQAGLIRVETADDFLSWMVAKIYNQLARAVTVFGLKLPTGAAITMLQGDRQASGPSYLEAVESSLEGSWQAPRNGERHKVPDPEILRDVIEDLCRGSRLSRVVLMIDEAAHAFIPEQQRQFFAMMRDLRSPFLSVKAAIYPGATSFGGAFQPSHDATVMTIERAISDKEYLSAMRDIVLKQDQTLERAISQNGEEFDALAYAATGNPRLLIKTLGRRATLNRRNAQETISEFYTVDVWQEHSDLAEKYAGHRELIEWGRVFVEQHVITRLREINYRRRDASSYVWVDRNAPRPVHDALRLLCYSGILQDGVTGVRVRHATGTRYLVNLGCHFALDDDPVKYATMVRRTLSTASKTEFGSDEDIYQSIRSLTATYDVQSGNAVLAARLEAKCDVLDLTPFQRRKLVELRLKTVGEVLAAEESAFQRAWQVGPVRARQIKNAAHAAVYEYLSG